MRLQRSGSPKPRARPHNPGLAVVDSWRAVLSGRPKAGAWGAWQDGWAPGQCHYSGYEDRMNDLRKSWGHAGMLSRWAHTWHFTLQQHDNPHSHTQPLQSSPSLKRNWVKGSYCRKMQNTGHMNTKLRKLRRLQWSLQTLDFMVYSMWSQISVKSFTKTAKQTNTDTSYKNMV